MNNFISLNLNQSTSLATLKNVKPCIYELVSQYILLSYSQHQHLHGSSVWSEPLTDNEQPIKF